MSELNTDITLYDINKNAMGQEKPLDPIEFNSVTKKLVNEMVEKSKYWMLLCRERNDYTVFIMLTLTGTLAEIRPTLQNRGEVIAIDPCESGAYEIWIRDPETKENFLYYLFDYTYGIVEA